MSQSSDIANQVVRGFPSYLNYQALRLTDKDHLKQQKYFSNHERSNPLDSQWQTNRSQLEEQESHRQIQTSDLANGTIRSSNQHPLQQLTQLSQDNQSESQVNLAQYANSELTNMLNSSATTKIPPLERFLNDPTTIFSHECHTTSPLGSATSHECNSSSNHLILMNIRSDELNFSDIGDVWLVKSWQEILLRVSFVAPIVLLGLIGNLTIIYSMCRFKPIRSKPTNIFILNMALADLLTTIVCPNAALLTDIYQFYVLGSFVCRFEGFIKITCLLVSAYSLIVLSFDWCLSVVSPCRTRITIKQSWLALISIWLVSIGMAMPLLYWRRLRERHWKDLIEIWCCELIQYTKYYWVGMTLFLIYLPTFIMTIVLIIILAQMDKFETKLRLARQGASKPSSSDLNSISDPTTSAVLSRSIGQTNLDNSLTISIKYRRRIVKILILYLLTSIVCWTPLQFAIVYRHFRTQAVPASWFFELNFYSQLCASLSAVMNPIIFGFLSQPFRRVVTKSWMFRVLEKFWATNIRNRSDNDKNNYPMDDRRPNNNPVARNNIVLRHSGQKVNKELDESKIRQERDHLKLRRQSTSKSRNEILSKRTNSSIIVDRLHKPHSSGQDRRNIHSKNSSSRPSRSTHQVKRSRSSPRNQSTNGVQSNTQYSTNRVSFARDSASVKITMNNSMPVGKDNKAYLEENLVKDEHPGKRPTDVH